MSFVDADDVIGMIDGLMQHLAKSILNIDLKLPLPRMTYDEAMRRYGHDAPDVRFGLELVDCTDLAKESDFRVFKGTAESGGFVRGINATGAANDNSPTVYSRKKIDELEALAKEFGAKGLAFFRIEKDGSIYSPIAKNFSPELQKKFIERMQGKPGDILFFVADTWEVSCKALYQVRKRLGVDLKLYDPKSMNFSWIVEFPMFDWDAEENRWVAMHHPFTAPRNQDIEKLDSDPCAARAQAYDLVINGYEAGGGTIRIHDMERQSKVFGLLGIDQATAKERFGFLLDALQFGAPPHGGIALGIDRCVMLFGGLDNIRDCIAFPKTQKATDLMTEAPGEVEAKQLRELGIQIVKTDK
jgi:aspartyl-tRNA synthetase